MLTKALHQVTILSSSKLKLGTMSRKFLKSTGTSPEISMNHHHCFNKDRKFLQVKRGVNLWKSLRYTLLTGAAHCHRKEEPLTSWKILL